MHQGPSRCSSASIRDPVRKVPVARVLPRVMVQAPAQLTLTPLFIPPKLGLCVRLSRKHTLCGIDSCTKAEAFTVRLNWTIWAADAQSELLVYSCRLVDELSASAAFGFAQIAVWGWENRLIRERWPTPQGRTHRSDLSHRPVSMITIKAPTE